jgi:hypothetical protein
MSEQDEGVREHQIRIPMFDSIERVDWEDLKTASRLTQVLVRQFASDKQLFRRVLLAVEHDPYLWAKCEEDIVEDKIVLWDDTAKGLRLRLRMSTGSQERLAHCHRFSFTNLVLRGSYIHWSYELDGEFNEKTRAEDFRTILLHEDRAGDCFTIHHEALHSTPFTERGTVSLILRGNPVKERAPVMFKEGRSRKEAFQKQDTLNETAREQEPAVAAAGDMFWRVGESQETAERRSERQMGIDRYRYWCAWLAEQGIV